MTTIKIMKKTVKIIVASAVFVSSVQAAEVEVLHWWTSGGEAKALAALKDRLQKNDIGWKDMPVSGGGGTSAMTVLRSRVISGNPPTASQMLGYDILDWGEQGGVANLNTIAEKENWNEVVPTAIQKFSKYDNNWIAVPVNVHSVNWVWANQSIMEKVGINTPKNWNDFISSMEKIKAAGYVALAHGGQAWQDATLFDSVVMATGGVDFYRKALIDLDSEAIQSETMKKVFDRMRQLREFVDKNYTGRDWNLASAMVINGKAAYQIMGDWAKGEFLNAGKKPDVDFLCFRTPGTSDSVIFNTDQFTMFKVDKSKRDAQLKMAQAVLSPEFQIAFNIVKGSAPARTDISDEAFDRCGKKSIADLKSASSSNSLIGSMALGHAAPASIKNAFYDIITAHFNGNMSSNEAVKKLASAVKNAF